MATKQIERHLTANSYMKKKDIVVGNFLGGIAWGLGTVIGASVIVGIIVAFSKFVGWGEIVSQIFSK
jgi:hypothetical protein